MSRGGARVGAGRKGLTENQMLLIGSECERRWEEVAEKQAVERYEALPRTKAIRIEQAGAQVEKRFRNTPQKRAELKEIAEALEDIARTEGGHITITIKRPYGAKPGIIADVIEYTLKEYGITVSASQVSESWKRWNKLKKSL